LFHRECPIISLKSQTNSSEIYIYDTGPSWGETDGDKIRFDDKQTRVISFVEPLPVDKP